MGAILYSFHLRTPVRAEHDGDDVSNVVITGIEGQRIAVLGYQLTVTAPGVISIQDTDDNELAPLSLIAGNPATYSDSSVPAFVSATGEGIKIVNPNGVDTLGHMTYIVVT